MGRACRTRRKPVKKMYRLKGCGQGMRIILKLSLEIHYGVVPTVSV
jgi:hypothetical protein